MSTRKIREYKAIEGESLIQQFLKAGFEPYGNPLLNPRGVVVQIMVLYNQEAVEQTQEPQIPTSNYKKKAKDDHKSV